MKALELDTNLLISVNNEHQIKVYNQEINHMAIHLPDWELVSSSDFRKKISLRKVNHLLNQMNLLATIYINNQKVITLGKKRGFGIRNAKLAFYYLKNILTGK